MTKQAPNKQQRMQKLRTPPCVMCGKTSIVEVTEEQYFQLTDYVARKHIQDIFPDKDADFRELLITGTHPECWEKIFGTDSEDEEQSQFDIDHAHGADFGE